MCWRVIIDYKNECQKKGSSQDNDGRGRIIRDSDRCQNLTKLSESNIVKNLTGQKTVNNGPL